MCTGINFESLEGEHFLGRTQEFDVELPYTVVQFPRNFRVLDSIVSWLTKYSVLGVGIKMDNKVSSIVLDGVNEHGLSASTQYFSEDYCYASTEEIIEHNKIPIAAEQFIFYLLTNCRSINEVEETITELAISKDSALLNQALPQHFLLSDVEGNCLVIEPTQLRGFTIYSNKVGVMTNYPKFEWHLNNLRNYTNLSQESRKELTLKKENLQSLGKGLGLFGLPGDFSSSSRFIRTAILLNLSDPVSSKQSISRGFHILNSSDIVKGVVKTGNRIQSTHYTIMYSLSSLTLFIRYYDNFSIQKVTLSSEYLDSAIPHEFILDLG